MAKAALIPAYSIDPAMTPGFDGPVGYRKNEDVFIFSSEFKNWMYAYQDGRCGYCGVHLGPTWSGNRKAHVEHIVNRRQGGSDLPPNVMYSCNVCNHQKRDRHFSVLAERIQFRDTGLSGIISMDQARALVDAGISLGLKPIRPFHFSQMNWAHVPLAVQVDRQRMAEEFDLSPRRS